ncbi:MAG: gliding motility-associated C-terminal domain-containing protein [Salibacteraceae bacterium]
MSTNIKSFFSMLFVFALVVNGVAQKEANNWYFGNSAAFHFNTPTGDPVAVSGSAMNTNEGCSSISDRLTGALLFYTDGQTVYNSNNLVMPNGTGLKGNSSSTNSSLVVPLPGDSNKYYIFTVPHWPLNVGGAAYSVVDMTLQSGLGDVVTVQKNVSLPVSPTNSTSFPVADKCAAISHANGRDYWVIVQHENTWSFYAYLLTSNGLSSTPVISTMLPVGSLRLANWPFRSVPDYGCMKISPDGKKMVAVYRTEFVLFDFNDQTGAITNQTNINLVNINGGTFILAYGAEFSPNSQLLYVSLGSQILQFNPHLATPSLIAASKVSLISNSQVGFGAGQLQLAPDLKIYCSRSDPPPTIGFVSRIDSPNVAGLGCAFRDTGVVLTSGANPQLGLPIFVSSFLIKTTSFSVENACDNEYVHIAVKDTGSVDSVFYNYGDPGSSNNTTWNKLDSHIFTGPGKYEVTAHLYYTDLLGNVVIDTIRETVIVLQIPNNDDLQDTVICLGDSVLLETNFPNSAYLWNTGAKGTQLWVKNPGKYWVKTTTICGSNLDSMELFVDENIIIDPINDSIICDSDIFEVEVTGQFIRKYLWNTGNTDSKQIINKSGVYSVTVENACGVDSMSFLIEHFETPLPNIGSDTVICIGDEIYLKTNLPTHILNTSEVLWNDQFNSHELDVVEVSWYKVSVKNKCGEGRDSIKVDVKPLPSLNFSEENIVCDNYLKFDFSRLGYRLLWQDGSEKLKYKISESGEYSVEITDELGCFNYEEFTVKECPGKLWVPNAFTPNYDATNEGFRAYKDGAFYFNLEIYDRWGKLVFTSEDITESWDGTLNNNGSSNCTVGTYVWKIKIKEYENTDLQIFFGEVALTR